MPSHGDAHLPGFAYTMARIPDKETYQRAWSEMSFSQRREILRAVARGQAMRRRKDARLAVATARNQQRYWKFAWLMAPAVALVALPDWAAVAVQAVLLSTIMGGFAFYRIRRAHQSEEANIARLDGPAAVPPKAPPVTAASNPLERAWNWVRSLGD